MTAAELREKLRDIEELKLSYVISCSRAAASRRRLEEMRIAFSQQASETSSLESEAEILRNQLVEALLRTVGIQETPGGK